MKRRRAAASTRVVAFENLSETTPAVVFGGVRAIQPAAAINFCKVTGLTVLQRAGGRFVENECRLHLYKAAGV